MSGRYDDAMRGLNSRVMASFGFQVVVIAPGGQRHPMSGDWRQEPLLIDNGGQGAVATYQATLGIDLHTWPVGVPRIEADWAGWKVEIPTGLLAPDIPAGEWDVACVLRPGGGWIDLELTNHNPAP